jgi:putative glycosyltransferase (TIGR04372 family)
MFLITSKFRTTRFVTFVSLFSFILPSYLLYHLLKNSLRFGNFNLAKKLYFYISKRYIRNYLHKRIFYVEILFYELCVFFQNKKIFYNIRTDYLFSKKKNNQIVNFIANISNKNYLNQLSVSQLTDLRNDLENILIEFVASDYFSLDINKYYEARDNISIIISGFKRKNFVLDKLWVQSIGHFYFLDAFIKAILLGIIKVKSVSFNFKNKDVANIYLLNKYKEVLKKKKVYRNNNNKNLFKNHMRYWFLDSENNSYNSQFLLRYIWKNYRQKEEYLYKKYFDHFNDSELFENFKKIVGIGKSYKKIVTVHIRQKGFYKNEFDLDNIRNFDVLTVLESINLYNKDFFYILLGDVHMKKIGNRFSNIFDYPHSTLKNQNNDIILINNCDAHIGTNSGITHLMLPKNIPTLAINWLPFNYHLVNESTVVLPQKVTINKKIIKFNDYYKIQPSIINSGYNRYTNLNLNCHKNSKEEVALAVKDFLYSLYQKNWINYGKKVIIKKSNFDFFGTPINLNSSILKEWRTCYLDNNFIKINKGFI